MMMRKKNLLHSMRLRTDFKGFFDREHERGSLLDAIDNGGNGGGRCVTRHCSGVAQTEIKISNVRGREVNGVGNRKPERKFFPFRN